MIERCPGLGVQPVVDRGLLRPVMQGVVPAVGLNVLPFRQPIVRRAEMLLRQITKRRVPEFPISGVLYVQPFRLAATRCLDVLQCQIADGLLTPLWVNRGVCVVGIV